MLTIFKVIEELTLLKVLGLCDSILSAQTILAIALNFHCMDIPVAKQKQLIWLW